MSRLTRAIEKKNISDIRKYFSETPVAEIADIVESFNNDQRVILFRALKTTDQSELFSFLEPAVQEKLIMSLTDDQIRALVDGLHTEEAADFVEELPAAIAKRVLSKATPQKRKTINYILRYDDDQVGSIMSTDILTIKQSWTVGKVIDAIKNNIDDIHFTRYFYTVDSKNRLTGYVKVKDFIFENKKSLIKKYIKAASFVTTTSDKEEAAQIFAKHDMSSLPVINSSKEVMGVITSDYVIDVIQEEASEDFQIMAGLQATEKPYSKTSTWSLFKSRTLWLLLLMISATLSQIVLDSFQNIANDSLGSGHAKVSVAITTAIVAILPVISGAAGNAGSQSSTTIIRALATSDITIKDYWKVFGKELKASSTIGVILALANFIRLMIYYSVTGDVGNIEYIALSGAASISLMIVIILAQIVGGLLPLIAKAFKLDPAVMAAPLLTTLIDALSTMIFFGISIGIMLIVI